MTKGQLLQALNVLRMRLRPILESDAPRVLLQAQEQVRVSKKEHDEALRQRREEHPLRPWGYKIPPDGPLRFQEVVIDGLRYRVDVICEALWRGEEDTPHSLRLVLRVWCLNDDVTFRQDWDASCIRGRLNPQYGRVMVRFHFDQASPQQQGPRHHVQVGGKAQSDECCWLHEAVSLPRLAYPPTDLVLACEMIAANFFPEQYAQVRSDPSWTGVIRATQEYLLRRYYSVCTNVLDGEGGNISLLDELWNISWT